MANEKRDVLLIGPSKPAVERGLAGFTVHSLAAAKNREAFFGSIGHVRAMAVAAPVERINDPLLARLPRLQIIASFGVGYDHIDANAAARRGIVVTHTPDVLTEEVADTAMGLLLCTVRELPQAERHLRAGKWRDGDYPLTRRDAAQPHRRPGRHGPHRPRHRPAARSLRRADRLPYAPAAARASPTATIPTLSRWRALSMSLVVIVPGGTATRN